MRLPHYWLYIFLVFTGALFFFYQEQQAPLSYDFAPDFDGNDYRYAYDFFTGQADDYKVPFPFHSRILVPWLAALIGSGDIISDFQWINLLFSLLTVWMLFRLWRQLGLELPHFLVAMGWLLFHWTGMIRLNAFDPITVDLPVYAFQGLFLLVLLNRKYTWLLLLGPVATLQKESFIGLLVLLTAYALYHNRREQDSYFDLRWILGALALSVATLQITHYFFPPIEEGKNSIITLLYHAKQIVEEPLKLLRWVLAVFMAFGPFLIAGLLKARERRHYDLHKNLFWLFSGLYLLYGILAGGDMTRIIFLGYPFIMTAILYELRDLSLNRLWFFVLLSLPLTHVWSVIPDPAFEWERWQSWYPEFASPSTLLIMGVYGLVCLVILLAVKRTQTE